MKWIPFIVFVAALVGLPIGVANWLGWSIAAWVAAAELIGLIILFVSILNDMRWD
jgi:hypothetical protein